jgi:hypothetical protein
MVKHPMFTSADGRAMDRLTLAAMHVGKEQIPVIEVGHQIYVHVAETHCLPIED